MRNRPALLIAFVIAILLGADYLFAGMSNSLFLAKKLADLTVYMAFWR